MFWGYVRHIRVTCESEQTQTRTRKQKILEKGETIRFGETFSREQWPVCVQCWRKWWIQPGRSISINSTFERLNGMHIYINGDNWLLWILSTIRSKTKIISARRVAYCRPWLQHCISPERNSAAGVSLMSWHELTTQATHNISVSSWALWV